MLTVVAAYVESLCEPFYAKMLLDMEFSMRAKAEGLSITVKTVLVYLLVFKGWGLLAYAVSQVAYSLMLLAAYILLNKEEGVSYNSMLW